MSGMIYLLIANIIIWLAFFGLLAWLFVKYRKLKSKIKYLLNKTGLPLMKAEDK